RSLSFDAFSEFQLLEKKIINQEKEINDLEKTLGENYRVIDTIKESNEKNTVELKILRAQNTELSNENSGFKSLNEKRAEEHNNAIGQLNQATKNVENREQKILQEKESREKEKVVKMKRQWQDHEKNTEEELERLCSRLRINYIKNPPLEKKPDNTIEIAGEFIIFDAKSPKTDDLNNFPDYIKSQSKTLNKYTDQEKVKKDIFLVVPSNTLEYISQLRMTMSGFNVFVIAKDSIELVLVSLKKIEDIDLAGKLDPRDRENLISIVSNFAYFIGRNGRINLEIGEYSVNLIEQMRTLVPKDFYEEIKNKVAGQTFNIAYDKPGKVENTVGLKKEIEDQKNKANRLDINPLNPSIKKELLSPKKE
ncbi:hypothetical protein N9T61_03555, partial [Flavobacteriaceae bacterium]|nr:hypothetical protein [Flavobacteriaceae bacterium]